MKSYGLENVKAFADTGDIDIAPITVFVGQNSCGKSSLIRFPVVLSQTFYNNHYSAFTLCLHSDRSNHIDYGNFEDVLHNHQGDSISCKFSFYGGAVLSRYNGQYDVEENDIHDIQLKMVYQKDKKSKNVICKVYEICINKDFAFSFSLLEEGNCLFNQRITVDNKGQLKSTNHTLTLPLSVDDIFYSTIDSRINDLILEAILRNKNEHLFKLFIDEKEKLSDIVPWKVTVEECLSGMKNETNIMSAIYDARRDYEFAKDLLLSAMKQLYSEMIDINYIGPFRQNPERIYRRDENAIQSVGKYGEFAVKMLINDSIQDNQIIDEVSKWFSEAFGYKVEINSLGHEFYQINLIDENNAVESNIMDVGYGISQVLPIVSQVAEAHFRKPKGSLNTEIHIIEQPELHLHPAAQSKLADLFVNSLMNTAPDDGLYYQQFLIETHSEHFIRALQVKIADPDCFLTHDMVKFYCVEKGEDESIIREMRTNEYGQFTDRWPKGFFDEAHMMSRKLMDMIAERRTVEDAHND